MSQPSEPSFADVLRAAAWLLEHPEDWEEFRNRFALATCQAVVRIAEMRGVPPDVVAKLREQIGM